MYFVSSAPRITKCRDNSTAGRTWFGLFLADMLLKSQPVSIMLLWLFPLILSPSSTHIGLDLEVCLSWLPTPVPPACFLAPDLEQSDIEGTGAISAKHQPPDPDAASHSLPHLLTCEWAFKTKYMFSFPSTGIGNSTALFSPLESTADL